MIELSNKLKQRFLDDKKCSIQVLKEPYFTERIKLYGLYEEYVAFAKIVEERFSSNEEAYFQHYNKVKDDAITFIKSSSAFISLNETFTPDFKKEYKEIGKNDCFRMPLVGEDLISIDIAKANFSSLIKYAKDNGLEFFDEFNYDKFISKFTDIDEIKSSKYIRQVIFGNCNPKKLISYERTIIESILDRLLENTSLKLDDVVSLHNDEIVFVASSYDIEGLKKIKDEVELITKEVIPLHFTYFTLGKATNSGGFVKKIYKDFDKKEFSYELKCAGPYEEIFIKRILNSQKVTDNDLIFYHEKRLAKFLEVPNIELDFEKRET